MGQSTPLQISHRSSRSFEEVWNFHSVIKNLYVKFVSGKNEYALAVKGEGFTTYDIDMVSRFNKCTNFFFHKQLYKQRGLKSDFAKQLSPQISPT